MSVHEHVNIIFQCSSRILVKMTFYPWVCCLTICPYLSERNRRIHFTTTRKLAAGWYWHLDIGRKSNLCVASKEPTWAGAPAGGHGTNIPRPVMLQEGPIIGMCSPERFLECIYSEALLCYIWFPGSWCGLQDPSSWTGIIWIFFV